MADRVNPDSQPADDTVRLIREDMIHAEQQSRYYVHLAHRFRRLGEILGGHPTKISRRSLVIGLGPT